MQKFNGSLIRQFPSIVTGNAAAGVQVTVYVSGTNTLATLYATDSTSGATLANPLTTNSMGFYAFYAPDGKYRLQFSDSRYTPLEVQLLDSFQFVSETESGAGLLGQAASAAVQSINQANNEVRTALDGLINSGFFPASGSFEAGGTITERNQFLQLIATAGSDLAGGYTWGGSLPKVVPAGSTPSTSGGLAPNAWTYRSDATVGSALVAGTQNVDGQPASTLSFDVFKYSAIKSAMDAGAGNAAAFNNAFANSRHVTAINGVYYVSDTIEISSSQNLSLPACTIVTTGMTGKPLFRFKLENPTTSSEQISIDMGGGSIVGDAAYAFEFVGVDTSPSTQEACRIIKITGVTVSAVAMRFAKAVNAAKSLFFTQVWHFGGMFLDTNGKVVETHISNSLIFGSGADTNGFLMESNGGTNQYSEGLHLANCTIDGYENCFNIRDMFVTTLVSAYVGGAKAFLFRPPTTTHNREFNIGAGCVFGGRIVFADSGVGVSGNGKISSPIFAGAAAPVIEVGTGWSAIDIENVKAESNGGPAGVAVWVKNGCNDININGVNADVTFSGGVEFTGANGSNCRALNVNAVVGMAVTSARPVIVKNPSLDGVNDIFLRRYSARLPVAVGVAANASFGSVGVSLAKGQTGTIKVSAIVDTASFSALTLSGIGDLSLADGAGWSSAVREISAGVNIIDWNTDFIAKVDIPFVSIGVLNGSAISTQAGSHAYISVIKDI